MKDVFVPAGLSLTCTLMTAIIGLDPTCSDADALDIIAQRVTTQNFNDQFHDDVAAIAARRVEREIEFAVVEELCPAGFLVGVGGAAGTDVVDFRFKCVAQDVDELHVAVVGAVADAQRADDDGAAADPWAPF